MMNDKYDITQIRILLDKYYRAESSSEEEEVLENFFLQTNDNDLPEDLRASMPIFSIIRDLHSIPDVDCIPETLEQKIDNIIETPVPKSAVWRAKGFSMFSPYIGIAIAVCIALIIGISGILPNRYDHSSESEHYASVNLDTTARIVQHLPIIVQTPLAVNDPVLVNNNEKKIERSESQPYNKATNITPEFQSQSDDEDGFFEITELEAAQDILLKIGTLLACNADLPQVAFDNIDNLLDNNQ